MNNSVRKIRFDFRILKKAEENLKWCMVSSWGGILISNKLNARCKLSVTIEMDVFQ